MSTKDNSIAIQSTNLVKTQFKLNNELKELSSFKDPDRAMHNDRIEDLKLELSTVDEEISFLEKRIENKVYELVEDNDVIFISLLNDSIVVDGIRLLNDVELSKIGIFLGCKHYIVQPHANWITAYFHNDLEVFDLEE